MIFVRSFLLALCLTSFTLAQRCDNGPCALGCCNEEGWCGFGPDCEFMVLAVYRFLGNPSTHCVYRLWRYMQTRLQQKIRV